MDKREIRAHLTGPFASICTPFLRDGSIDYDGLRSYIDRSIAGGSKTVLLTYGDSLYSILTDREVSEVTQVVCEHTAGRAMVVAADRQWPTGPEVEFAHYVRDIGADVLMVLPPDWAQSCTVETLVEHYSTVARHIPVMLVTNVFASRGAQFGLRTIQMLLECDGIVAVKDDLRGEFARRMCLLVRDHWAVVAGGQKQAFLDLVPYGCHGYMSDFIVFAPEVSRSFWTAVQRNDPRSASDIIARYEYPLFDYITALPGGFDAGMHGVLEVLGITQRWRRKPYYSLSDGEMERLRSLVQGLGL